MEHPTMRSIIDIIAEQLAIRRTFINPESQLCKLDADESEVYTILCTIEDTFHIKWGKDKKIAIFAVVMTGKGHLRPSYKG